MLEGEWRCGEEKRRGRGGSIEVEGVWIFFFQAEEGIRDLVRSRGLGYVYKRQATSCMGKQCAWIWETPDTNRI